MSDPSEWSLPKAAGAVVLALVALGFAARDLSTGEALVVPSKQSRRSTYDPSFYTVTRDEDPVSFYGEVAVLAGTALYLLYATVSGARRR